MSNPNPQVSTERTLRVLVDTNVLMDLLRQRNPWYSQAVPFWQACTDGKIIPALTASTLTDVHYLVRKAPGDRQQARQAIMQCLADFLVLDVTRATLETALNLSGPDFEDDVQIASAMLAKMDLIVTRNLADYAQSAIPAVEPIETLRHREP